MDDLRRLWMVWRRQRKGRRNTREKGVWGSLPACLGSFPLVAYFPLRDQRKHCVAVSGGFLSHGGLLTFLGEAGLCVGKVVGSARMTKPALAHQTPASRQREASSTVIRYNNAMSKQDHWDLCPFGGQRQAHLSLGWSAKQDA